MVGKGGLAEPQAPFLEQISLFQTTDAGIYMNVVDNDPMNDGQVFFYQRLLVFGKLKVLLHPASPTFRQHARMYTPEPADRGK